MSDVLRPVPYGQYAIGKRVHILVPADDPRICGFTDRRLTPREQQIVELLADDKVTKEIAEDLGIEEHTVVTHIRRAYAKLGVTTRAGLVGEHYRRRFAAERAAA